MRTKTLQDVKVQFFIGENSELNEKITLPNLLRDIADFIEENDIKDEHFRELRIKIGLFNVKLEHHRMMAHLFHRFTGQLVKRTKNSGELDEKIIDLGEI